MELPVIGTKSVDACFCNMSVAIAHQFCHKKGAKPD